MGKTKIKIVDDSAPVEEGKKQKPSKKVERDAKSETDKSVGEVETPTLEKDARGDSEEGSRRVAAATEGSEDAGAPRRGTDTELAGPRAEKKPQKLGKAKPRSKKYQQVIKDLDRTKSYPIPEAVDMVKKLSYAKFNATIEAHINTVQTGLRGFIALPYASGKSLRILVFPPAKLTPKDKKELEDEGVVFGNDSTIESIAQGKSGTDGFDLIITSPEWMPHLAKVAKILGPKGLMPNPKNGTIISGEATPKAGKDGLKKTVESFQAGKTEYKTESKAPVIHMALGKLNQPNEELAANIKTLLQTLGKSKIKKVSLSPTMGPSVKVDLASI